MGGSVRDTSGAEANCMLQKYGLACFLTWCDQLEEWAGECG